ncbi:MAG: aspartate carbamoyltransferase [Methylobacter sp.]|nr:aspartate carbamoyltransferase [Methylobacter sp.]
MNYHSLLAAGLLLFSTTTTALEKTGPERINEVLQRSQEVLPYSLDKTRQMFTKTVHGGVQHVVAKSPDDTRQIKLIQANLRKRADEMRKGDFSDTERIHGADMPGLVQLKLAKIDDIKFEYEELPDGAQIHYSTEYPQFVQALHEWFDGQISDHGNELLPGHKLHHATPAE